MRSWLLLMGPASPSLGLLQHGDEEGLAREVSVLRGASGPGANKALVSGHLSLHRNSQPTPPLPGTVSKWLSPGGLQPSQPGGWVTR